MKNINDKVDGNEHKFQTIGGSDCSFGSINPGFFEQPNLFSDGIKAIPNFGTKDLMGLLKCSRSKLDSFRHRNGLPEGSLEKNGRRSRTVYSLSEYREWVRCIRQSELRPDGSLTSPAVISFVGTRSGSGKTFAAATLAQGLCQRGHRILIIDLDGQASLSQFFGKANVFDEDTYLGVVNSSSPSFDGLIQNTKWDGIDIIPATAAIFDIERLNRIQLSIFSRIDTPIVSRFGDCLHEILIREVGGYDFVIIDTHSGVDALAMASVLESSALIYPVSMNSADIKSADWYLKLIRGIWLEQKISERRPEYDFIGFFAKQGFRSRH